MDPISFILTALATGATVAVKDTASQTIKDAYSGLKASIQRHFADKPDAKTALEQFEKKPDIWKAPLADAIREKAIDKDEAIIEMAKKLLKLVDALSPDISKYNIHIENATGIAIGDQASTYVNAEKPKAKKK